MHAISVVVLVIVAAATAAPSEKPPVYDLSKGPELFEKFIKDYNKQYKDEADKQAHYKAFLKNVKYINDENAKGLSYTLGINQFADMTEEEKNRRMGLPCVIEPNSKDNSA